MHHGTIRTIQLDPSVYVMVYVNHKHNLIIYHQSSLGTVVYAANPRYARTVHGVAPARPRRPVLTQRQERTSTTENPNRQPGHMGPSGWGRTQFDERPLRTSTSRRRTSNLLRTYLLVSCSLHTPVSSCSCRLRSHLRSLRCDCAPSAIIHASNSES